MKIGSLCSGYGGLEMGIVAALSGTVAWHVENDPAAAKVLAHHHPHVPNHGDLTAIAWADLEPVDVLCAGFPCQPVSGAGLRKVTGDDRWLWPHIAGAVRVLRPRLVIVENVAGLLAPWRDGRWWIEAPVQAVVGDLAALGYDATWRSVRASDVGAPHRRQRVFIVAADPDEPRLERLRGLHPPRREGEAGAYHQGPADPDRAGVTPSGVDRQGGGDPRRRQPVDSGGEDEDWGAFTPAIRRWERTLGRPAPPPVDADGDLSPRFVEWMMGLPAGWVTDVALSRAQQLKILGNGVVPQQAAHALATITAHMETAA